MIFEDCQSASATEPFLKQLPNINMAGNLTISREGLTTCQNLSKIHSRRDNPNIINMRNGNQYVLFVLLLAF